MGPRDDKAARRRISLLGEDLGDGPDAAQVGDLVVGGGL
jgi:hypothetical protein